MAREAKPSGGAFAVGKCQNCGKELIRGREGWVHWSKKDKSYTDGKKC